MHFYTKFLVAGLLLGNASVTIAQQSSLTAINIALDPDNTMIQHAKTDNARLRKNYPKGFSLDKTHNPHVTLVQMYVRTADLDTLYHAVAKVLATEKIASRKFNTLKYYYIPTPPNGLAGIVVRPTEDLLRLQKKLIEVVEPLKAKAGNASAFFTTPEEPDINKPTIEYAESFIAKATGENFNPHVTIGVGKIPFLDKMVSEPFNSFIFSLESAAVYQLGNFGTARKKLKTFQLMR